MNGVMCQSAEAARGQYERWFRTLDEQVRVVRDAWGDYDYFFVHHKYTDSAGEDGDLHPAHVKDLEVLNPTQVVVAVLEVSRYVLELGQVNHLLQVSDATVEAVLVFYAHEPKEADERLIAVICRIATQLGFALRHKQLEERLTKKFAVVTHMRDSLEEEVFWQTGELTQTSELLLAEIATREQIEEKLEAHLRQERAIAELSRQALAGMEFSLLMQAVAALTAKTLNVEFCKILELLPDRKNLVLRAGVGWGSGSVGRATVSADKDSQAGYTLLSRGSVIVVVRWAGFESS